VRVALATCAALPGLDEDGARLLPALAALGVAAEPQVWDDPAVDWVAYDLVVVRSTWDYTLRREEFLAWAAAVPHLANPLEVLRWNTDKGYLTGLAAAGVPVVPTLRLAPGEPYDPPAGELVVKPAVSAGARDTVRVRDGGRAQVAALHAQGRAALVQPYLPGLEREGETSLLFCDGELSHGARKAPLLPPGGGAAPRAGDQEITARTPTSAQVEVARAALAAVPGPAPLLYARVDLVPGEDGQPVVLELELTEPSLFLWLAPGAAGRYAAAIRGRG
jgi:glutathione synthase/RimK-type ligase-like ATP-grasp enzyme